jgi:hypothetical protein
MSGVQATVAVGEVHATGSDLLDADGVMPAGIGVSRPGGQFVAIEQGVSGLGARCRLCAQRSTAVTAGESRLAWHGKLEPRL